MVKFYQRLPELVKFALTGWVSGSTATLILGLLWPFIFPAIVNVENYYESGPGLLTIITIVLVLATPAGLIGGIIGGRSTVEGGPGSQRLIAIIFAILLALPIAGFGLWSFTGE